MPDGNPWAGSAANVDLSPLERKDQKGAPGGYAGLDAGTKIPGALLPLNVVQARSEKGLPNGYAALDGDGLLIGWKAPRENWNPVTQEVPTTTTPERALMQTGRIANEAGDGGVNYLWGAIFYGANPGTAPVTPLLSKAYGQTPAGANLFATGLGNGSFAYGVQVGVGMGASKCRAVAMAGSDVLTVEAVTVPGSRFHVGNALAGARVPAGATIVAVDNEAFPTAITMSAPATQSGTATVTAQGSGQQTHGVFITGTGGNDGGPGNPDGRAVHVQSYTASAFKYVLSTSGSALRSDGTAIRIASETARRFVSVESGTLEDGEVFASTTVTGSVWATNNVQAAYGLRFSSDSVFSTAAIFLPGHAIATDTVNGMRIATTANQLLGFYGKTPVARGTVAAAATDAASTQTLANSLRTALFNLGLVGVV